GLGLVGQLTVQLLKAGGCRVFGIDVATDKVQLALAHGADAACLRSDADLVERVRAFSAGRGADAILIAAAASSSDPVQIAPSLARDRAVVVAVGMIGMDVPRNAYYEKELQLRLSRSYGPGRYDRTYEEEGVDYPLGYVRWTEQRNMEAFLDLVAAGGVQPSRLVTHRVPIADAERAYQIVTGDIAEPYLGILLEYPRPTTPESATRTRVDLRPPTPTPGGTVRFGVIGAGNFARSVLLPTLKKLDGVDLRGVATALGPSAHQTAARFGFGYAATDWRQVVDDAQVDAVVIATRHDVHARVAAAALRAGKSVFLEKPMALSADQLEDLLEAWRSGGRILQVGFNRRFAPTYQRLKAEFAARRDPLVMTYRVNAGPVSPTSWVVDPVQGGGRLVGEVCHMVDLLVDLTDARVTSVYAEPISAATGDDVVLTLRFADGSIGTIVYASGGDRSLPKEQLEVLGGGRAAVLDDFRTLRVYAGGGVKRLEVRPTSRFSLQVAGGRTSSDRPGPETRPINVMMKWFSAAALGRRFAVQDKGHAAELAAFVEAVRHGKPSPVDPETAAHVTRVTFAAVESARSGVPIKVQV
ncbi:MAG TPA: Gfo/Idh/MocA family oxidoreductase, partial [Chloroflexota bacterium]|nr:Gfo/Idh/MocA family oxidoreductase [Chloroflexota bacterium]